MKAYTSNRIYWAVDERPADKEDALLVGEKFYLKSEADKVIAEKDAEIVELKKQVHDYALGLFVIQANAEKEARRHKYRRCLAMAKLCNEKWLVHNFAEIPTKLRFYDKWEKRWLELAEQFKGAK